MIKEIIEANNITSHVQLDKHLSQLTNSLYYWSYEYKQRFDLERVGLLKRCVEIEFDNVIKFYEDEIIK